MVTSWYEQSKEYKSPLRVVAAFLMRSRDTQVAKNQRLSEQVKELAEQRDQDQQTIARLQQKIDELSRQRVELEKQRDAAQQSVNLPNDPPVGTHGYGPRMISRAVNVA